jgi:hypothetical protein
VLLYACYKRGFDKYFSTIRCFRFLTSQLFGNGVRFRVQVAGQNNKYCFSCDLAMGNKRSTLSV